MAANRSNDSRFAPLYRLSSVRFLAFTSEDIKKMSCKRITNPNTFDSLLHPSPGGLHDPALGPCDKLELCGTCGLNYVHCPGHIGHIVLPLIVFHPIFFQTLYKVLRGSCFVCSRFLASPHRTQLLKGQITLLEKGLVSDALELEFITHETSSSEGGGKGSDVTIIEQIQQAVQSRLNQLAESSPSTDKSGKSLERSKHLTDLRRHFVDDFFKSLSTTRCPHCSAPVRKIRHEYQSKVMMRGLSEKLSGVWRAAVTKTRKMAETTDMKNHLVNNSMEQHFLTPLEAREHVREVWGSDPRLMSSLFSSLRSTFSNGKLIPSEESSDICPVDMFFVDVVAVPPSRFRPVSYNNTMIYRK